MTTVIADRRTKKLYADSRITARGVSVFSSPKLFSVKGPAVGCAGDMSAARSFVKWLEDGMKEDFPDLGEFDALQLFPSGRLLAWDETGQPLEVLDAFYGIGSGGVPAMCLLTAGLDPMKALEVVAMHDVNTAGPFCELETFEEEKKVRRSSGKAS
jgi:hypothetical protein